MSENPLLAVFKAQTVATQNAAPKPTGNPLLDTFSNEQSGQQGFDFGAFQTEKGGIGKKAIAQKPVNGVEKEAREQRRSKPIEADNEVEIAGTKFWQRIRGLGAGGGRVADSALTTLGLDPNGDISQWLKAKAAAGEDFSNRPVTGEQTWEALKAKPSVGGFARFVIEQGASSIADMGALASGIGVGAYVGMQSGSLGQQRAENNADLTANATAGDTLKALPAATASALLERLGMHGIFGATGKTVAGRIVQAFGAEAVTEAIQSPIEYAGSNLGTAAGFDPREAADQALAGAVAGGAMGGAMRAGGETFNAATGRVEAIPASEQIIDQTPASVTTTTNAAPVAPAAAPVAPVAAAPVVPATPAEAAVESLKPVAQVAPRGVVAAAATEAAQLSQADLDSPIPNETLAQGKAEMAKATAAPNANSILRAAGLPDIGGRVTINWNGTAIGGEVLDALDTDAGPAGRAQGVRIRRDDGTTFEEHFDTIRDLGVQIAPEAPRAAPTETPAAPIIPPSGPAVGSGGGTSSAAPARVSAPASAPKPAAGGIPGFMARVAKAESPSDTAKNSRSSAEGRYQFTDGTFEAYYRKVFPGTGETKAQILAKKTDGALQDRLMSALTQDNGNALRKAGVTVTDGNRYLAHFAGPGGAVALNKAAPNTPVEQVLSPGAIKANPFLKGKTASEVVAWAARKVGSPTEAQGVPSSIDVNDDATPVQFQDMDWGDTAPPAPEAETSNATDPVVSEQADEPATPALTNSAIKENDGWPVEQPIRNLGRDDGRFAVRGGATITTPSGRETSPAPKFTDTTPATRTRSLNEQEKWLRDEAIAEAEGAERGNPARDALRSLRDMSPGAMSQSDHGTINDVLFGDYEGPKDAASWKTDRPPVKPVKDRSVAIVLDPAKGTVTSTPAVRPAAPLATAPTFTDTPSGKGIAVANLTDEQKAIIARDVPKAKGVANKDGSLVYSKKQEDAIRKALATPAESSDTATIPSETARVDPVRSETQVSDRGAAEVGGTARVRDDGGEKSRSTSEERADAAVPETAKARSSEPALTPDERTALTNVTKSEAKGGLGWHKESGAVGQVNTIMENGGPRNADDRKLVDTVMTLRAKAAPATTPEPEPTSPAPKPKTYGAGNKLFTSDAAEKARAKLRSMSSQLNSVGFDPEVAAAGLTLIGFHIESGARSFIAAAKAVSADLGLSPVNLRGSLRSWYSAARNYFEDNGQSIEGMDDDATARALLARIEDWGSDVAAPAQETTDGIQGAVSERDAGSGTRDIPEPAEDRSAGRDGTEEVGRGAQPVRGTDEGRTADAERGSDRPGDAPDSGAERARPATRLPATRAGSSAGAVTATNFTIAPGALDEARGPKAKAQDNLKAINVLKRLAREQRPATAEEQATLAQYVGWGGLKNVFPDGDGAYGKGFEDTGRMLRSVLTDAEYDTARRSIQYAHFTSETIVREMWRGAEALGFTGGSVFEPGMGTGNFAGMMPPALAARTRYAGIEMDGVTAGIAKALYPQSGISLADYTRYDAPKDAFDLVIGNPPFSETVVKADPAYKRNGFVLHDYFFAKSLDSVKPGGLLMFVTSAGTMNKLDTSAREYLAARADLVGAIRLPGEAFEENAGATVTTDIIVLRKRAAGDPAGDATWTETKTISLPTKDGETKEGSTNRYFAEHPEMVLGEEGFFDARYGERYAVRRDRSDNTPFAEKLAAAFDRLGQDAGTVTDTTPPERAPADLDFESTEKKNGAFYLSDDGQLMQQNGSAGQPVGTRAKGVKGGISAADQEKIKKLVPIRDALRDIYRHDLASRTGEADAARGALNTQYDAFVAEHGPINKGVFTRRRPSRVQVESARRRAREEARARGFEWEDGTFDAETLFDRGYTLAQVAAAREEARADAKRDGKAWDEGTFDPDEVPDTVLEKRPNIDAFMDDPESYRLRSIEHYNDSTGEASKGPVFFQNVVSKQGTPEIRNAVDALYHTLNLTGRVDLDAIGRSLDMSPADVIDELAGQIYRMPAGEWEPAAKYLSGNVRAKLLQAEAAAANDPSMRGNVEALQAIIPSDLGKSEVRATLGMAWIDSDYIEQFGKVLGLERMNVSYQPVTAGWSVNGDRSSAASTSTWGTDRRSASELIDDALNGKSPKIYDTFTNAEGNKQSVLNSEATQAAGDKLTAIKERFKSWIYEDDARAAKLLRIYNDTFNNLVAPEYDGSFMTTPGISALWSWRPHQTRVMARIVQQGNTYMAHAVGAGKTSAMIGAGMEMKRLGLVNKPMYVVPNHMLAQFTKEFYEQYPTARIMVADDDRNFITDKRKQFVSDMALADLDAVIIKHSAFGLLPLSNEYQEKLLGAQLTDLRETLEAIDKSERQTRRKIEQMIEQADQRLRAVTSGKKDQTFTFEETGVDFLFVDEAHLFRKLDFATSRGDVKGIDPTGSMRSMDLFMKTRNLEERRPGRSHVLASGTAITNTMAELYSISRYLQPETLRERGIDRFDAWASAFGDTVTDLEPTAGGTYKPVTRFSQFVNVPELSAMVRQIMDVVTPEQLEQYVTRPEVRNHMVVVPESAGQAAYREQLQRRMEAIEKRTGPPKKGDDIMLSVINDGRNAAIDMRLVDPANDEESTKLMEAIENVARIWKATKRHPFYEVTASGYSEQPAFHAPAAQMVFASRGVGAGRAFNVHRFMIDELAKRGVPREEMVNFNALKNDVAKQRVFNDMKTGKVRILFGSVDKMGTGVNAQRLLAANHNMDPEWLPSSDEQRNGRIIRQGNLNKSVDIYNYSTKGTYDSAMWGMMGRKAKFIEGFFRGDPTLRDMEDLGEASKYEQAKALTTRDPRILVLTEAKQELEKELRRRSAHESDISNAEREAQSSNRWAARLERSIVNERADLAQRQDISGDAFTAKLGDETFTERTAFQDALKAQMDEKATREDIVPIGEIGGFTLARLDYKTIRFTDTGGKTNKEVSFLTTPVLLLNGDDPASDGERRYKELAKTGTAVSASNFLSKLDRTVAETEADIARYKQRAQEFAARAADTGAYAGDAKIKELESEVAGIEKELATEQKAAEAAKAREDAPNTPPEPTGPQYSVLGSAVPEPTSAIARETAYDAGNLAADRDNLSARLQALGISDRITLAVVDRIENEPRYAGQYWKRVITVATGAQNADGSSTDTAYTLDHESIHAIKELGLFRPAEWTALSKRAMADTALMADIRKRYAEFRNLSEESVVEEAIADMYATWRRGREETGFIGQAFTRIRDLLVALRKLFGGGPTGGSTMRDIESGEIGTRQDMIDSLLNPKPRYSIVQPAATVEFSDSETEKRWKAAAEGLGSGDGLMVRIKANMAALRDGFTRHWENLPNEPRYAALQQKLRGLESAPQAARERAVRQLSEMVKGFTRADLDLLARKVVLDDLIWEADQDHELPFGLTPATLKTEKQRIDAIVDAQPGRKVWAAAMKRKLVNRNVANELVAAGVLDAERVKNPSYFRHQVLEYARAQGRAAAGGGSARLRSPKWAKRMGSSLDINANILEAEFDWLSKAMTDIPTAQAIDWIKKSEHNILERLQKTAKDSNEQGIADLIAKEKDRDGEVTAKEREFRGRFAFGFKIIQDELDAGTIRNIPRSVKRGADAIQSGQKGGEPPFEFLSWLLDSNQPGAKGAAIILMAVGERRSFRAEKLGNKYVDPADAEALIKRFAPEGYSSWQPEEGKLLFTVKTLPEHAIDMMVRHLDSMPVDGVDPAFVRAQLEKARTVMVVGGDKYKMILPTEVAKTLSQLRRPDVENLLNELLAVPLKAWKRWVLINPRRIIKYNLNNLSGDLDAVLAGNPALLRRTPEAARELASVMRGKAQPSARYEEAVARGVFDSGLSIQEIPDINSLSAFAALTQPASNRPDKLAFAAIGKAWRGLQGFTTWRENVFRYAAYLDYADRIEAGQTPAQIGYGASVPAMVDAITTLDQGPDAQRDQAALLARDLMGDYGAISANGAWLRSHVIPFWSWTELNTKRYWRLTMNAYSQGAGKGIATGGALAISRGAAVSVGLGLRMSVVYGLINLWNWLFFDDEEKELSEQQQRQLHIILGKNADGEVVTLRTQGAFSDVLGMLGLQDAAIAIKAREQGRGGIGEIIAAPAKALVNRVATSTTPLISIPVESATGKKLWPDAFNARPIRDGWRNLAQTFSLENEYDLAASKPSRGYGGSFVDSVVYRRQPGEIAYDEARGLAYQWNNRVKGSEGSSDFSTPRSSAMRDYRTALRYGDESAADKALDEMGALGVTEKDMAAMVKRAAPLAPIAKKDRAAFLDQLTDEELEKFRRAETWFDQTFN